MTEKINHSTKSSLASKVTIDRAHQTIKRREDRNIRYYRMGCCSMIFTLGLIILFFAYLAPTELFLTRAGVALMVISAILRIGISISAIKKSKSIQRIDKNIETIDHTIDYHKTRTVIHKIVSPLLFISFTIGFCSVLPEFAIYLESLAIVIIMVIYTIIAVTFGTIANKNVDIEMQGLSRIIDLKVHMGKSNLSLRNDLPMIKRLEETSHETKGLTKAML